ncbi:MAG: NUDIX domain-containing protein [Anaerolineae bacterium]|nr:NUDIX domain-containing protein [Anaerolineae bacterium]
MTRIAHYCPVCGTPLEMQEHTGALRPICPQCDYIVYFDPKVAVAVCILQDDRILLIRRGRDPLRGLWAMPAGFMDYDEDPQAAARREALEETGLEVHIERLLDVFHTPNDGGMANIVIVYAAHITSGTLEAADDADDVAWFSKTDAPEVAFLPSQTIIQRWLNGEL